MFWKAKEVLVFALSGFLGYCQLVRRARPRWVFLGSHREDTLKDTILTNRGYDQEELEPVVNLLNTNRIPGMAEAIELIGEGLKQKKKFGFQLDYDVDGAGSGAQWWEVCDKMGVEAVFNVPERADGYGLTEKSVLEMAEQKVEILILVDNGTTTVKEVALARSLGMKVIVFDHHMINLKTCAKPDIMVNVTHPKSPKEFSILSAGGLSFCAIYNLHAAGLINFEINHLMAMAALTTIADQCPLTGVNRFLVHKGLKQFYIFPGLKALIAQSKYVGIVPRSTEVSFQLATRLNAGSRVSTAQTAFQLLIEKDMDKAEELAAQLSSDNDKRKKEQKPAMAEADELLADLDDAWEIVFLCRPNWGVGWIGPMAGALSQRYGRPAFVGMIREDGTVQVSARQGGGVFVGPLIKALVDDGLAQGGGHDAAGGFSTTVDKLEEVAAKLQEKTLEMLDGHSRVNNLSIDALWPQLPLFNEVAELAILEPTGREMEQAMIVTPNLKVEQVEIGKELTVVRLHVSDGNRKRKLSAFQETAMRVANIFATEEAQDHLYAMAYQLSPNGELHLEDFVEQEQLSEVASL